MSQQEARGNVIDVQFLQVSPEIFDQKPACSSPTVKMDAKHRRA